MACTSIPVPFYRSDTLPLSEDYGVFSVYPLMIAGACHVERMMAESEPASERERRKARKGAEGVQGRGPAEIFRLRPHEISDNVT